MTWNRSVGTALGARATASVPSSVSMISRPPWNSCPKITAPFAWATSARRVNPGMHASSSAVSSWEVYRAVGWTPATWITMSPAPPRARASW